MKPGDREGAQAELRSALYHGSVFHSRRDRFAKRRFQYSVVTAVLDLDELPELHRRLRLFSHNRPNLYSFYDRDYRDTAWRDPAWRDPAGRDTTWRDPAGRGGGASGGGARQAALALFAQQGIAAPRSIRLVTNLRVAGYVFNPVSYFLGYDEAGALTAVIAEVNNTYGGSKRYVLGPAQRLPAELAPAARPGFRHVRELFVSPFLHGPASYDFHFDAPLDGERLAIRMNVHAGARAEGPRVFIARLEGERQPLSDRALLAAALRYPLMTVQVIALIHYQALKLHLLGAPYRRPGPDHRPLPDVAEEASAGVPGARTGGQTGGRT